MAATNTATAATTPRDVTIPWIAWGQGVTPGKLRRPIDTTDTAATVLWLLGVETPEGWDGAPVADAFTWQRAADAPVVCGCRHAVRVRPKPDSTWSG